MVYTIGQCPKCGHDIISGPYGYYCENKCGFLVSKYFYGRKLDDWNLAALLAGEDIYLGNMKKKDGGKYSTFLHIKGLKENPYTKKDGTPAMGYVWDFEQYNDMERYIKANIKPDEEREAGTMPSCSVIWRDLYQYLNLAEYMEAVFQATIYRKLNAFAYFPILNLGYEDPKTHAENWIIRHGEVTGSAMTYIEQLRENPDYLQIRNNSTRPLTYERDEQDYIQFKNAHLTIQIDDSDRSVFFCQKQDTLIPPQERVVYHKASATVIKFPTPKKKVKKSKTKKAEYTPYIQKKGKYIYDKYQGEYYVTPEENPDIAVISDTRRRAFWIKLGNFVSHTLIHTKTGLGTPKELNNIDRFEAAEAFIEDCRQDTYPNEGYYDICNKLIQNYGSKDNFILVLAKKIDESIPKAYKKNLEHIDGGPSQLRVKDGEYGLHYMMEYTDSDR